MVTNTLDNLNKDQNLISVIIYTCNNMIILNDKINIILNFLTNKFNNYEIIIADNHSHEDIKNHVKQISHQYKIPITFLQSYKYIERENLMQIAIDYSIGDFIIEIHDVGTLVDDIILHQIYQQSQIGYDIVFANANKTKISSTLFYKLLKLITKDDYYSTPIYMLSRRAINLYKNNKHKFAKIQYKHLGLSWVNIYFNNLNSNHDDRSIGIKLNNAINIFLIYTSLGFNISAIISIVFGLISLIFGSYALLTFIFLKKVQTGWASTAIFLSFGFFGIFLLLSMIIKYLELILKYNLDNSNPNLQTIEKIQHD